MFSISAVSMTKTIQPSYGYSIISVALVLTMIGIVGLAVLQANGIMNHFKEKVQMLVEIKPSISDKQFSLIERSLNNSPFLKENSLTFLSKAQSAELLSEDFGVDLKTVGFDNPLYDVFTFNLKDQYLDGARLKLVQDRLKENPLVHDVYYQSGIVDGISKKLKKVGLAVIIGALLFLFLAITLIYNTIKLALVANRETIKNMQLVGATWGYISRPYLLQSLKNGLVASLLAMSVLMAVLLLLEYEFPEINSQDNMPIILALFIGLISLGLFINLISTWFAVNKTLNMRIEEM